MINGINKDGFAYVLYINGGHQQWMILYPFQQKLIFASLTKLIKTFFINVFLKIYILILFSPLFYIQQIK